MFTLFHRDLDGICSAAIVKHFDKSKDQSFHSINYNEEIPFKLIKNKELVYIVDYSLNKHEWEVLFSITKNIIWIDHHKSIFEKYCPSHLEGVRVSGKAACQLTWEYFSKESSPMAVKLIADYDVWRFKYKDKTTNFYYGIQSENYEKPDSNLWKYLLIKGAPATSMIKKILRNGICINSYVDNKNKQFISNNKAYINFEGIKFITANKRSNSMIFDSVDPETFDAMLLFGFNGKTWNISLYSSSKEIDMSVIARKYGGGGHAGAAGFEADFKTLEKILKGIKNNV